VGWGEGCHEENIKLKLLGRKKNVEDTTGAEKVMQNISEFSLSNLFHCFC